ncbi:MAG: helix-turn-helix domain-containing protein [Oscillospiraceae bacterium]|nr:helix-turn-helix domain-containing protein [Oscillospiraceae bacterium]
MKNLNWSEIGLRIKKLRQENDITIERLCEIINVSPSFIGLIERGDSGISIDNLYKLSQVFNASVDYLLTGSPDKPASSRFDKFISNIYDYTDNELNGFIALSKFINKHYNIKTAHNSDLTDNLNKEPNELHKNHVELKKRYDIPFVNIIKQAKREIFISGVTLHALSGVAPLIESRSAELDKIRLLVLNTENAELVKAYENMRGFPLDEPSTRHLKRYLKYKNIEIREIDSITPVIFVATDINESYGYIKAEHYFNNRQPDKSPDFPCIELEPRNTEWYNIYKNQIKVIWERGKDWTKK